MAKIEVVSRDGMEYCLSDFWMKDHEGREYGPVMGFELDSSNKKSAHSILKSLDSDGRGQILADVALDELRDTKQCLVHILDIRRKVPVEVTLPSDKLGVTNVRYITANSSGPQEMIGFSWNQFNELGRPRLIKGDSRIVTTYEEIAQISKKYLRNIR